MTRKKRGSKKIFLAIVSWFLFLGFIFIIPPAYLSALIIFYLLLFLSLAATLNIFASFTRSLLWSLLIIIYLILRQNHLDNNINTLILLGILVTLEIYLRR